MQSFEQQVRERTYHLWLREGGVRGQVDHHWFQAVRDTLAEPTYVRDENEDAGEVDAPRYRATAAGP